MYRISPFTPLFFNPSTDSTGTKSRYVQTFSPEDRILLQVISTDGNMSPQVYLHDVLHGTRTVIAMLSWEMNSGETLFFRELFGLYEGIYVVGVNGMESEPFRITWNIKDTVLLQYSNFTNRLRRDAVFVIDGMPYFFDFRVPGGFKDDDWAFGVDNEQYTTSENDVMDIYGMENMQKTLTLGGPAGCPVWFAEKLNRILCCSFFYVDGRRYVRSESSVPEMNVLVEGLKSYVFKQALRPVNILDPELKERVQFYLRRVDSMTFRSIDEGNDNKPKMI